MNAPGQWAGEIIQAQEAARKGGRPEEPPQHVGGTEKQPVVAEGPVMGTDVGAHEGNSRKASWA